MEYLINKSNKKTQHTKTDFKRYLFSKIDWQQRLILILGHRGTGKTTLILQHLKDNLEKSIYLSLDDYFFETNRLVEVIEALHVKGYRSFYIDEIHRYEYWSKDLKNMYDDYPDSRFIVTGSSILEISKGQEDLSRRAVVYTLSGLSFREFLLLDQKIDLPKLTISDIINNHSTLSVEYLDLFELKTHFKNYLNYGYYPFYQEGKSSYHQKLNEVTNLIIDSDIAPFEELNYTTVRTMKKLLYVISQSVPFTPNVSKLSTKLQVARNTILMLFDILDKAQLISLVHASTKGITFLQKPEKIYLQNTNLSYMFSEQQVNIGNLRETFFFNQLNVNHVVSTSKYGDFMIDGIYTFEIGGQGKTSKQIQGVPNAFLAIDETEFGSGNRIPLWLFGFMY
jgi:hypothetical protein